MASNYKVIKQGFLQLAPLGSPKKHKDRKRWRRYWFLLIEDPRQIGLLCFKSEMDYIKRSKHQGFIRLDNSESYNIVMDPNPWYANCIAIKKEHMQYIVAAETRYEIHEWLSSVHDTLEAFKARTSKVKMEMSTQTDETMSISSDIHMPTQMAEDYQSDEESSESDCDNETDNVGDLNRARLTPDLRQSSDYKQRRETWSAGDILAELCSPDGGEGSHRRRRRTEPVHSGSRNLSPPRDPPPPPPGGLSTSHGALSTLFSPPGNADEADGGDQPIKSPDTESQTKRISFSTFKSDNSSQLLPNGEYHARTLPKPVSIPIHPNSQLDKEADLTDGKSQTDKNNFPNVYSEDFYETHSTRIKMHRRKMSAPANLILGDTAQFRSPPSTLANRRQHSHGTLLTARTLSKTPEANENKEVSPPPVPPRVPVKEPAQAVLDSHHERQPSLRKVVSKDFLSHLTTVLPMQQQRSEGTNPSWNITGAGQTTPSATPTQPQQNGTYEPEVDEVTKVSVNEIKRRLFGEGTGSSPISSAPMNPPLSWKSPPPNHPPPSPPRQPSTPPRQRPPSPPRQRPPSPPRQRPPSPPRRDPPTLPKTSPGSQPRKLPSISPSRRLPPTPLEENGSPAARRHNHMVQPLSTSVAKNPNYPPNDSRGPKTGYDFEHEQQFSSLNRREEIFPDLRMSSGRSTSQERYNEKRLSGGHHQYGVQVLPVNLSQPVWANSSQSVHEISLRTAFPARPISQSNHMTLPAPRPRRTSRNSTPRMVGAITDLDAEVAPHPHNKSDTALPNAAYYSPKASPPDSAGDQQWKKSDAKALAKDNWQKQRNIRRQQPVQTHPGRTTPTSARAMHVFDTTVEWDEDSNTTLLNTVC